MKPSYFLGYNTVYAKDQLEYQPLPVFKSDTPEGECISCWKLSFLERLTILFTGKIWLSLYTFNNPLTPSFLTVKKEDLLVMRKTPFYLKIKFVFVFIFSRFLKLSSNSFKWKYSDMYSEYTFTTEKWIKYKEKEIMNYYQDKE